MFVTTIFFNVKEINRPPDEKTILHLYRNFTALNFLSYEYNEQKRIKKLKTKRSKKMTTYTTNRIRLRY
jgi:hypothetical protein